MPTALAGGLGCEVILPVLAGADQSMVHSLPSLYIVVHWLAKVRVFFGLAKPYQKKRENFVRTAVATNTTTTTLQCQHNSHVYLLSTSRLKPYPITMFPLKNRRPCPSPHRLPHRPKDAEEPPE